MELRRRHIICCLFLVRPLLLENDYKSRPKSCILLVRNFLTISFSIYQDGFFCDCDPMFQHELRTHQRSYKSDSGLVNSASFCLCFSPLLFSSFALLCSLLSDLFSLFFFVKQYTSLLLGGGRGEGTSRGSEISLDFRFTIYDFETLAAVKKAHKSETHAHNTFSPIGSSLS